ECAPGARSQGQIAFNMNLNMQMSSNALASNGLLALLAGANSGGGLFGASGGLGNSGMGARMLRALAARAATTPANGLAVAPSPEAESDSRIRTLTEQLRQTLTEVNELSKELARIRDRLDKLDKERGKSPGR